MQITVLEFLACVAGARRGDWGENAFSPQSPLLAPATQASYSRRCGIGLQRPQLNNIQPKV